MAPKEERGARVNTLLIVFHITAPSATTLGLEGR
jgi:hypothetical protein